MTYLQLKSIHRYAVSPRDFIIEQALPILTNGATTLTAEQEEQLQRLVEYDEVLLNTTRQTGTTTLILAYLMWKACFSMNELLMLVQPNHSMSVDSARNFSELYNKLPNWVKPKMSVSTRQSAEFSSTGVKVLFSPLLPNMMRGRTLSTVIFDLAHLYNQVTFDEVLRCTLPALACNPRSKLLITKDKNCSLHTRFTTESL
jgi:N12 class adenine-specific DNA methylase